MGKVPRVIARRLLGYVLTPASFVAFLLAFARHQRERHDA